jgi:hypothetical protein
MNRGCVAAVAIAGALACSAAQAAYTETSTVAPVSVSQVYSNEWGSPFVVFSTTVNPACSNGNGLYLYDITQAPGSTQDAQYRNNKMSILLMAMASGKQVTLEYFYDPGVVGWAACYIEGIQVIN